MKIIDNIVTGLSFKEKDNGDNVRHGTDGECYICHKRTCSLAGNPHEWPSFYPYPGGNGKWRRYCNGCIIDKLNAPLENKDGEESI